MLLSSKIHFLVHVEFNCAAHPALYNSTAAMMMVNNQGPPGVAPPQALQHRGIATQQDVSSIYRMSHSWVCAQCAVSARVHALYIEIKLLFIVT